MSLDLFIISQSATLPQLRRVMTNILMRCRRRDHVHVAAHTLNILSAPPLNLVIVTVRPCRLRMFDGCCAEQSWAWARHHINMDDAPLPLQPQPPNHNNNPKSKFLLSLPILLRLRWYSYRCLRRRITEDFDQILRVCNHQSAKSGWWKRCTAAVPRGMATCTAA